MGIIYDELYGEVPEKVKEFCDFFETSAEDMKLTKISNRWILYNENEGLKLYLSYDGKVMFFEIKWEFYED